MLVDVGSKEGANEGGKLLDGSSEITFEGIYEVVGDRVGLDGINDGAEVGIDEGIFDGVEVGIDEGIFDGFLEGRLDGIKLEDGGSVGSVVGTPDGFVDIVGNIDG